MIKILDELFVSKLANHGVQILWPSRPPNFSSDVLQLLVVNNTVYVLLIWQPQKLGADKRQSKWMKACIAGVRKNHATVDKSVMFVKHYIYRSPTNFRMSNGTCLTH